MEDVDRSKSTVREGAFWLIKEGEIDAIATDIAGEANNAAEMGNLRVVEKRAGRRWVGERSWDGRLSPWKYQRSLDFLARR